MPSTATLPSTVFATNHLAAEERFEAWRSSISVIFDVAPMGREPPGDFQASVTASHLGALLVGDLHFGPQQFSRGSPRVARDGVDHYLVQWYRSGGFVGQHDDRADMAVHAGDITVFDLGRTQRTYAQPSHVLSLVVPREIAAESFGKRDANLHGTVLRQGTALGGLLSDYLRSLHHRLPDITLAEAPAVVQATTQMLAACLRPSRHTLAQARAEVQGVTLERIQRHIAQNLATPLGPDVLCHRFGISRSMLYRLFEPLGGVAHYVQQRRLLRAFHALASPANRRLRVAEVAARNGFLSEAHFSRTFRAAFGLTPSDVRAMAAGTSVGAAGAAGNVGRSTAEYADWVRALQV
ncbi:MULTISPECIES: helix-turn-helix domain-containing protein [unclassified Acidovorax]|uniref:helix-turn-helix domain-containing protein n=1 Tax=unclassified Acidovorax TaxID=2684926 RepID=UPI00070160CD|nr:MULTISPECIES: helix-turn-helix domain-containing protein [unclassified Acidovorax]KRB29365.1 AraC family transcriptional regulator [Acidovorax sp. Root70]PUA98039.1 AraC family transcriptional regulator [Acidovorax sp. 107]